VFQIANKRPNQNQVAIEELANAEREEADNIKGGLYTSPALIILRQNT
jgi:hypothetical protein